jgi:hypothetical protein
MSGFFGIFRPQGGPVDLEAFEQMKTAMHLEGFDGMETHVEEKIAMGHLMLRVSPESKYDKQPLKSSCGNFILVGHFRLDYRDELGDKLGLTQSELELTPDSQLAMLAYQKWKGKCVHHLEGDWSFVLINKLDDTFLLLKDHSGVSSLYFLAQDDLVVFSDEIVGVEAYFSGKLVIDKKQFARVICQDLRVENGFTLFKNVFQVKAGSFITLHQNQISQNIFKQINLENGFQKYRFISDYRLEFESIFQLAVNTRVKNSFQNGIYLSSGHDSSTVMYFLAKELELKKQKLHAFTSRPHYLDKIKNIDHIKIDETILVRIYLEQFSNVIFSDFDCANFNFSKLIESRDSYQFQNPIIPVNQFWFEEIARYASGLNVKAIFTGQRGNLSLSMIPFNYFLELLLRMNLITLFKDFKNFKKQSGKTYRFLIGGYLKNPMFQLIRWYFMGNRKFKMFNPIFNFPWMIKLVNKNIGNGKLKEDNFINGFTYILDSKKFRKILFNYYNLFSSTAWWYVSKRHAVHILDPTSDYRFLNFSFNIPEKLFFHGGVPKFLFKEMMGNKPEYSTIINNFKIPQSFDLGFRIEYDQTIRGLVNSLDNQKLGNFDFITFFESKLDDLVRENNIQKKFDMSISFLEKLSLALFISRNPYICSGLKQKL